VREVEIVQVQCDLF